MNKLSRLNLENMVKSVKTVRVKGPNKFKGIVSVSNIHKLMDNYTRKVKLKDKKLQLHLEKLYTSEQPVEVVWYDACGAQKVDRKELHNENITPSSYLVHTCTYGIVENFDEGALMLVSESSDDEADYTCIPINWIAEITPLERQNKYSWNRDKSNKRR